MEQCSRCRAGVVLAALAFFTSVLGCGSPAAPGHGSEDGKQIARLVEDLNEAAADVRRFRPLFSGAAPKNFAQYGGKQFDVAGDPAVSGDSATAQVKVRADTGGEPLGVREWGFVKEAGKWKIKSAPLP